MMRSGIGNSASDPLYVSGAGGANPGTGAAGTPTNPTVTRQAQNAETFTKVTLVAATAATILAAGQANGARVLNWTAAPVYIVSGTSGTPASGAPSDYIPAAASGVPGQWEASYAPTLGLRAVGASAGDLTVVTF